MSKNPLWTEEKYIDKKNISMQSIIYAKVKSLKLEIQKNYYLK